MKIWTTVARSAKGLIRQRREVINTCLKLKEAEEPFECDKMAAAVPPPESRHVQRIELSSVRSNVPPNRSRLVQNANV